MKAPDIARGIKALKQLEKRAGVDDAAVGQRRQELLVQQLRRSEPRSQLLYDRLGHLGAHFAHERSHLREVVEGAKRTVRTTSAPQVPRPLQCKPTESRNCARNSP